MPPKGSSRPAHQRPPRLQEETKEGQARQREFERNAHTLYQRTAPHQADVDSGIVPPIREFPPLGEEA
jgi:hypothetical protein